MPTLVRGWHCCCRCLCCTATIVRLFRWGWWWHHQVVKSSGLLSPPAGSASCRDLEHFSGASVFNSIKQEQQLCLTEGR